MERTAQVRQRLRDGGDLGEAQDQWSPQISLGTAVLIPDSYVSDLQVRLGLYRRLSMLDKRPDIDAFAAELVDRFGELPLEVRHLLDVVEIKGLARQAGVQQIDAGPKGAVIAFRKNQFANPEGLVQFMQKSASRVKLQADHKLVFRADWPLPEDRLRGVRALVRQLAEVAAGGKKAA
jgi:transcription-repair coupling factor (superfamily II helicase)